MFLIGMRQTLPNAAADGHGSMAQKPRHEATPRKELRCLKTPSPQQKREKTIKIAIYCNDESWVQLVPTPKMHQNAGCGAPL